MKYIHAYAEARIQKALNDSNGLLIPVFRFSNHIPDDGNMVKNGVLTKK